VYDIAFAPGLDNFLEASQQWFSREGFELLAGNRPLLGLVLAYLTLVSANHDAPIDSNDTLASQEARVTWGLLSLCVRPEHHGDKAADKLAQRFRALESLLTGEPLTSTPASMSEFVHQEPEPEPEPKEEVKQSTFERQLTRRSEDFWKTLESVASAQGRGDDGISEIKDSFLPQVRGLLDGRENRDIIYSTIMLGWGKNGDPSSERELAKRFLQTEASSRATELVCKTMAGMAMRAFDS
jgi:white-opaque regulator 2